MAKPKPFSKLTRKQQIAFANKAMRAFKALANVGGARYKVVNSPDVMLRDRGWTEGANEDEIFSAWQRGALLDMARNGVRNSPTLNAILKQFDLNAVGTVGGKATFSFPEEYGTAAEEMREAFGEWARDAEYFDGMSFGALLKVALKTFLLGGDFVMLFDDAMVEDSGRILLYEPDMIGDIPDWALEESFGKGATQSIGRVTNRFGRLCGVSVSRSQRGKTVFDPEASYILHCDPSKPMLDHMWIMPRHVWRVSQGRGTSPLSGAIATIADLEDLALYELQAAKKNSQTIAQILTQENNEVETPSAFDGVDFSGMTADQIDAACADVQQETQTVSFEKMRGAAVLYEQMPAGMKMELLDTKHPNQAMPEFIRWLAGRSAAPFGLGSVYATLKADASYTAFRGEQVMSWPAFEEAQKFLESSVCDWVIRRWSVWAAKKRIIDVSKLPAGWARRVSWQWPRMREVNQVDEQNALAMKLKNGTGSYADVYGADWREKLAEIGEEIAWCQSHGLPHPALQTASGAVISQEVSNA